MRARLSAPGSHEILKLLQKALVCLADPLQKTPGCHQRSGPSPQGGVLMVLRLSSKASGCRGLELQVEAFQGLGSVEAAPQWPPCPPPPAKMSRERLEEALRATKASRGAKA